MTQIVNLHTLREIQGLYKYRVFGCSQAGAFHIAGGIENQDRIGYYPTDRSCLVVAADGVGSRLYPGIGAGHAIESARIIQQLYEQHPFDSKEIQNTIESLSSDWISRIEGQALEYATTLCFALLTGDRILLGGIGDSLVMVLSGESFYEIVSEGIDFQNETASLAGMTIKDDLHIESFPIRDTENRIIVFVATDGIAAEIVVEQRKQFLEYLERKDRETGEQLDLELSQWVDDLQRNNGDDKSLVCLFATRMVI